MSLEPIFLPTDQRRPSITVRPEKQDAGAREAFEPRKAFQKATLGDGKALASGDFIDLINPLQHIPIVGHVYRAITGDTISKEASIVGGTVFGGPIGLLASAIGAVVEHEMEGGNPELIKTAQTEKAAAPSVELAQMTPRPMITPTFSPPPPQPAAPAEALLGDEPAEIEQAFERAPKDAVPAAAEALAPKNAPLPEDLQKHDAILELFGSGLSSMQETYRQNQQLARANEARRQLTA